MVKNSYGLPELKIKGTGAERKLRQFLDPTNRDNEESLVHLGHKIATIEQAVCYVSAISDIVASHYILVPRVVVDIVKTNLDIYNYIVALPSFVRRLLREHGTENSTDLHDYVATLFGSTVTVKKEKENSEGIIENITITKKINPKLAERLLVHTTNHNTNIHSLTTDLSSESGTIEELVSDRSKIELISKDKRKHLIEMTSKDPQQKKAFDTIINKRDRGVISLSGAVRCGKSVVWALCAILLIEEHINTSIEELNKKYNTNRDQKGGIVFIGKTSVSLYRNVFAGILNSWIKNAPASKSFVWKPAQAPHYHITLSGGHETAVESLKGSTFDLIFIDELDTISEQSYQAILERISNPWARIIATWNPKSKQHYLSRYTADEKTLKHKDMYDIRFNLLECTFADKKYLERLINSYKKDSEMYKRRVLGEPANCDSLIYPTFNEEKLELHNWSAIDYMGIYIGCDYGYNSPTVYIAIGVRSDGSELVCDVLDELYYPKGHCHDKNTSDYIRDFSMFVNQFKDGRIKGIFIPHDAGHLKKMLEQYSFPNVRSATRKTSVKDGIAIINNMLNAGRIKISTTCKNLIDEFYLYSWKQKKSDLEDSSIEEIEKQDDHALDALRYAITSCKMFESIVSDYGLSEIFY